MRKSSLLVYFCGGLGNQLFQYAFARRLALENDFELFADHLTGFARDVTYRRVFELNHIPGIHLKTATLIQRFSVFSYFICKKLLHYLPIFSYLFTNNEPASQSLNYMRVFGRSFILEKKHSFIPEILHLPCQPSCLIGYWQSFSYIEPISSLLLSELTPPPPSKKSLIRIGLKLRHSNSLALGIRLYEDSPEPSVNCHGRNIKSLNSMHEQISLLQEQFPDLQIAVFCTHRPKCLDELVLHTDQTIFLTGDDGVASALDTLWLITHCRHHLFFNSTLYWWGAFLSQSIHGGPSNGQKIIASDNFLNQSIYPSNWDLF